MPLTSFLGFSRGGMGRVLSLRERDFHGGELIVGEQSPLLYVFSDVRGEHEGYGR